MWSKGIDFRYFKTKNFSFEIVKRDVGEDYKREFTKDDFGYSLSSKELEGSLNPLRLAEDGFFQFFAKRNNGNVYERSLRVGTKSGNINDEDISNMFANSIINPDYCISFGLYDSDAGIISGLPNRHQVWACLTENRTKWQETLIKGLGTKDILLKNMVLPGSHDAGMYMWGLPVAMSNFANTQKENTSQQLKLGARFFDFRPATLRPDFSNALKSLENGAMLDFLKGFGLATIAAALAPFVNQLRHIHALIPGDTFENFITQIKAFLEENTQEIVVVKISNAGILSECAAVPSQDVLKGEIKRLLGASSLKVGDKTSLKKSVKTLVNAHERLIILFQNDLNILSSYDDGKYAHYEAHYIVDALKETMSKNEKTTVDLVDLQAQLTATNCKGAIARAIAGGNIATSPLLATKSRTDIESYPWLLDNLKKEGANTSLITIINDFYDNGLTEIAFQINRERFEKLSY